MTNLGVMRTTLRCVVAAIALAIAGCASSSQHPAPTPEAISAPLNLCAPANSPPNDIASQPGYVQYAVTVTDANGNLVDNLKQADFVVYVPEHRLPIKYFHNETGKAPQSIIVVIDESGSMVNKLVVRDPVTLQSVRREIGDAAEKLNRCDEVAVIAVGGHPANSSPREALDQEIRVIQPLTTDHKLALSRIQEQVPWGQTPLYDGITQGLQLIETAHYPNRVLIVVSDGLDNTSEVKVDEVLDRARTDLVTIYVIGVGNLNAPPGEHEVTVGPFVLGGVGDPDRLDAKTIKALSTQSGGQYFIASELANDNGNTFVDAVGKVASAVGHSYSIGVTVPKENTSEMQPITIGLANSGTLRLNARKVEPVATSGP
jgi:VWFA-related protein